MISFISLLLLISGALSTPVDLDPSTEYLVDPSYYSESADLIESDSTNLAFVLEEELASFEDDQTNLDQTSPFAAT